MHLLRSRFRGGWITPPDKFGVAEIGWHGGVDYASLEKNPESLKWWLSCFGFLKLVCTSDRLSESDDNICKTVILDWYSKNRQDKPALSRSWDAHAVALRTESFLEVARRALDASWLNPILFEQMQFLSAPENYQGNWNHGVDQSRALILVAKYLKSDDNLKLGISRLRAALDEIVDDEGVTIEQSVHYQLYNFKQIETCLKILHNNGVSADLLKDVGDRQSLMPDFLAHATTPVGSYFELGDTPWQKAIPIDGTSAEYAATMGQSGPIPRDKVKVYSAGYIFGRSGWGTVSPFSNEAAYAIRFGSPRMLHGHNDHLSIVYWCGGQQVLRDGGFHGYTDDPQRNLLRLAEAHNCLVPVDKNLRFKGCETELVDYQINDDWQIFRLVSRPYDGVELDRSFLICPGAGALIVSDKVHCDVALTFEQRWFIGDGLRLEQTGDGRIEEAGGAFFFNQHYSAKTTHLNPDNAGLLLAGKKMYELERCASIHCQNSGTDIRFLSSFAFGAIGYRPLVYYENRETSEFPDLVIEGVDGLMRFQVLQDGHIQWLSTDTNVY